MPNRRVGVTLDINADISQLRGAASEMHKIFDSMKFDGKSGAGISKLLHNLDNALTELEQKSNTALTGLGDAGTVEKSVGKVKGIISSLSLEFEKLGKQAPKELVNALQGFNDKLSKSTELQKEYAEAIKKIEAESKKLDTDRKKASEKYGEAEKEALETLEKVAKKEKELQDLRQKKSSRENSSEYKQLQEQVKAAEEKVKAEKELIRQFAKEANVTQNDNGRIAKGDVKKLTEEQAADYEVYLKALENAVAKAEELKGKLLSYESETSNIGKDITKADKDLAKLNETFATQSKTLDEAKIKFKDAEEAIKNFNEAGKKADTFDTLKENLSKTFGDETLKNVQNVDELKTALEGLANTAGGDIANKIRQMVSALSATEAPLGRCGKAARDVGENFKKMSESEREIDHLTSRLKYFFSLAGGFQLMRRAIRSAIDTTKELDAVMTQTAVVSDYSVGDMWKTLPQYSKYAKDLGAQIKDVYSAQTLYVQQGLNMNDAMDLGIETLKMARVAGIDAAEATDTMTAALRGFKMELTETSAVRINDVYSKLAQNTASDVKEISTAMSKVAALANSANMSFENTSAFLATIIESTREGAETAGTALKTVIARFSEVKKLYTEGELTGTDEEGQEVDVNKISAALRTAGINMNEFFTGAKGLDEIFMELGSKWSGLTTVQQRYIATMAAGSRQQSRFLALMQNYSRTVELTQMAYNSAGSGQEQFEKTLDSLEAKLNKLKAAWDTFTMGIANSDFIKGFIDTGTQILELINNIIDKISGGSGAVKSVLSLATAFGAFKIGGAIFKGALGQVGAALGAKTLAPGEGTAGRFTKIKQNFSTMPSLLPSFGRTNKETGEFTGLNAKGRLKRINANSLAVAHDQGVAEARTAQKAYETERAKLVQMEDPQTKKAFLDNARKTGANVGVAEAEYNENLKKQREEVTKKETEYKTAQQKVSESTPQQVQQLQAYGAALQNVGMVAGVVAGALSLLASKLEQGNESQQKAAKVVKGFATGLTVLSVGLMLVGSAAQIMGAMVAAGAKVASTAIKSIPIIGWALAIISAIISVIQIIRNLNAEKSPEQKWDEFIESCDKAAEGAKKVQEAYQDAMSKIENISAQQAGLDELIVGTEEWDTAVKNLNQSIMELIKLYPGLADAVQWVNDHWELDAQSDAYKAWLEENKRNAANANVAEIAMNYGKARQQSIRDIKDFQQTDQMRGYKKQSGFLYLGSDWSYQPLINDQNRLQFQKQGETSSVSIHNSYYSQPYKEENGQYTATDNPYQLFIDTKDDNTFVSTIGKGWDYLGKLLGDRYLFDSQYVDKSTGRGASEVVQSRIKKDYGIENADQLYSRIAPLLEQAINDAQVTNLPTLEKFYQNLQKEGTLTEGELNYFTNLIKDENGEWRQNIPIEEFLRKFTGYQLANSQVMSGAVPLLTAEFSSNANLDKRYGNTYLAYGKSRFAEKYLSYNDEDLATYENKINPLTGESYGAEAKKAFGVEVGEMGKTLEELGFADAFKEYMRYQLPLEDMFSDEAFEKFDTWFKSLDDVGKGTREAVDKIFGKDISNINIEGLKNLQKLNEDNRNYIEEISGLDLEAIESDYQSIFEGIGKYQEGIESLTTTWTEAESLATEVKKIQKQGGKPEEFLDLYKQINDNLPVDKLDKAKDILKTIDWGDTNSIRNSIRSLNDLGATIDYSLVEKVIEATSAVSKFNLKTVEEQIKSLEGAKGVAEKLGSGETTFSNEDYNLIKNLPFFQREDWVQTGLDEWTYVGEETNSILASIDAAVSTLLSETIKDTQEDIAKGSQIADVLEDKIIRGHGDEGITVNQAIEQLAENPENANPAVLSALQTKFGLSPETNAEGILDYYNKYYGVEGAALQGNVEKLAGLETYQRILPYEYTSAQSVINDTSLTQEEKTQTLENSVKKLNAGEQYMAQQDIAKIGKDFSNVINALAVDAQKADKRFDSLTQTYKNNADALKTEKKGSREYGLALANLTKAAKTAFNNNDKITEDFVDKHLDLFKDYSEGVDGAEDNIRKAMLEDGVIEGTQEQISALQTAIDGIDGEELSINGTADFSSAFAMLAELYGSAEAAAEKIRSLGYSVTWEPAGTTTMEMPDGTTRQIQNYKAIVQDTAGKAVNNNKGGGGGGGGGGGKEFKNDFDKYYNMVEDINELERLRNLLETDYQQILASQVKSGKEIYDNLKGQLKLLEERRAIQADLAEKRKDQIVETMNSDDYKDLQEYAWWNDTDKTLEINWDLINNIKDSELGDRVKEYVSKMEGFQGQYDEAVEALEEIESTVQEIKERGKEQYDSLENRTRDALIQKIQNQIDDLTKVDEAISEANQRLLDSISETLEMQRQERENAKTEESLSDKEQRLAYLRQDSSNANDVEIARLEKELAEEREDYTDTLIDQKISELQKQNEKAQEQRQQQIDLMQESLDYQEKSGAFWDQVYEYINNGVDAIGNLIPGSDLTRLLQDGEAWTSLSQQGQMEWLQQLEDEVAQAVGYLALSRQLEELGTKEGTKITFTNANGQTLTGKVDKNGNVVVTNADGSTTTYKDVYQSYDGTYHTMETEKDAITKQNPATNTSSAASGGGSGSGDGKDKGKTPYVTKTSGWKSRPTEHYKVQTLSDGSTREIDNGSHQWNYATKGWKTCSICGYHEKLSGGGCFVAGTQITVFGNVLKNIEDIRVNDMVLAYDEETKVFDYKRVRATEMFRNNTQILHIELSNHTTLKVTPSHPILTIDGWKSGDIYEALRQHHVETTKINVGDIVIGQNGNSTITNIKEIYIESGINVFNLSVEDYHTYLAEGIVVHNVNNLRNVTKYATGGLNTSTGPAWLDGTPSKPELILNPRDTENFIQLKDVLSDMRKSGNSFGLNGGDNYYDIDVHVDQMSSDYDVDRAIDRIKTRLAQDGAYRNVNTLSRLR